MQLIRFPSKFLVGVLENGYQEMEIDAREIDPVEEIIGDGLSLIRALEVLYTILQYCATQSLKSSLHLSKMYSPEHCLIQLVCI